MSATIAATIADVRRAIALLPQINDPALTRVAFALEHWLAGADDFSAALGLPRHWRHRLLETLLTELIKNDPAENDSELARRILTGTDARLRELEPGLELRSWRREVGQIRRILANTGAHHPP